ncbi:hypothetical protein DFH08DRAFT_908430 [Mycena albidolilacea]|uniref:Secreted protein n=1 Tax=Mycena albidolilacea TaxID=1033008 RepID=A0AAD6YWJ0_9AGAR|nr:hypothetical protein DFH08DRAFT_908430 [Mycena albidolilacea]
MRSRPLLMHLTFRTLLAMKVVHLLRVPCQSPSPTLSSSSKRSSASMGCRVPSRSISLINLTVRLPRAKFWSTTFPSMSLFP